MKSLATLIPKRPTASTRHEFEFQEVCTELEPTYGKAIWTVPSRVDCTEFKLREAHKIAVKRGKANIGYLIGVMKRL